MTDLSGWIIRTCHHSSLPFKSCPSSCRWGKWGAWEGAGGRKSVGAWNLTVKACMYSFPPESSELASRPWSLGHRLPGKVWQPCSDLSMSEVVKKQNPPPAGKIWLTFYAETFMKTRDALRFDFEARICLKRSFQCRSNSGWKQVCLGWFF